MYSMISCIYAVCVDTCTHNESYSMKHIASLTLSEVFAECQRCTAGTQEVDLPVQQRFFLNSGNKKNPRKPEPPPGGALTLGTVGGCERAIYAQMYKPLTKCLHHLIQSHHVYSVIYYYDLMCKLMALKRLWP